MIYFDHNATTPVDPLVLEAMLPFYTTMYGNPSSLHRHGRAAQTAVELARQQVASLVNVEPNQVIFTSGGTEANNLAIFGSCSPYLTGELVVGSTEHPSVNDPIQQLAQSDFQVNTLTANENGLMTADELSSMLNANTRLISVMHANNETGVVQQIAKLAEVATDKGVCFHTDAVQSAGKINLDFNAMNVDLMSLSAHKIYGPKGVGALVLRKNTNLKSMMYGGGQELGLRPGTENVAAIIGFGQAAELAMQQLGPRAQHLSNLKELLESGIKEIPTLSVVAEPVERLPNTAQITIDNIDGEMLLMQLDQKGIAVSSGSACSSNSKEPSPVLKAMGYSDKLALSAIRVSLGQQNTQEEVMRFISSLKSILNNT